MSKIFTKHGLLFRQNLITEQAKKVRQVGKQVGEADGDGCDWHDNFAYDDAKRRLEMESSLLSRLQDDLRDFKIIEVEEQSAKIAIGVTTKLRIDNHEEDLTIGAWGEAGICDELVQYNSPIGSAIFGRAVGELVKAKIGNRSAEVRVLAIYPPSFRYNSLVNLSTSQTT